MAFAVLNDNRDTSMGSTVQEKTSVQLLVLRSGQKPFQCGLCSVSFFTNEELLSHVETYSCSKPFQCGYCQISFRANNQLLVHAKLHKLFILVPQRNPSASATDSVKTVSCSASEAISSSCEVNIDSKETGSGSHSDHLASSDSGTSDKTPEAGCDGEDTSATCSIPLEMTTENIENNSGVDEVHDDSANNETNGVEENKDDPSLLSHNTELTETSLLGQPGRQTTTIYEKGNRIYKCGECDAVFSSSPILSDHWKSNHSACSVCGVVSPDPQKRHKHYQTSHGISTMPERTMLCGICGNKFSHTYYLQSHIRNRHIVPKQYKKQKHSVAPKQHERGVCSGSAISEAVAHVREKRQPSPVPECEVFKCGLCHKIFITARILSDHWKSAHSTCSVCGETFPDPAGCLEHLKTIHGVNTPERPFVCGVCGTSYATCRSLYDHVRRIHLKPNRKASVHSINKNQYETKQPPDTDNGTKMFKCGTCEAVFGTARSLSDHWKSQHSMCSLCETTFHDPLEYHLHCRTNHDTNMLLRKAFVCVACNENFVETTSIYLHVQKMHPKPNCNSVLGTEDDVEVKTGQQASTENAFQLFKCCECDSFFSSTQVLSSHWEWFHGLCILCKETFSVPKDRYRHVELKHDKISVPLCPFVCGVCGKKFSTVKHLLSHARVKHSEEYQQLESAVCVQNVNAQSGACAASPTGLNLVKCGECDDEFKLMSGLLNHWLLQHSACLVCGERFANPRDRHRHFQTKHEALLGKRFVCAVCGTKWPLVKELSAHLQNVHGNIKKEMHEMQGDETRRTPSNPQEEDLGSSNTETYSDDGGEHQVKVEDSDRIGDGSADSNTSLSLPHLGQNCTEKHRKLGFRCGLCDARFGSADQLSSHWTSQHSACGICQESCPDPYHLQQHMQTSHDLDMAEDRSFTCATCGAAFLEASCLNSHIQCSHQQKSGSAVTQQDTSGCKTYEYSCQCAECGAYFKTTHSLLHHWQDKHQSCSVCGECFKLPEDLEKHLVSSHGQPQASALPFVCAMCGLRCALPMSLVSHVVENHSKQITEITDSSVSIEARRVRERATSKARLHMCHVCGKKTNSLKAHLVVHSDERPHACTLCTKSFKTKVMLKVHMRTHTKERPYMCHLCGQSFTLSGGLTYHVYSHTNAKPYKCRVCGQGFNNHAGLKQHHEKHTGYIRETYLLPCKLCGKRISHRNHKRHMLTHNNLRPFPCKICYKTFRHKRNLRYHMNHSHTSN